ncbi:MAG: TlpA family protein disulfide reductase [Bacteroidales bacterium]|nr:TlpA family protein disulfide reductase [Bacteroidales bacterium]MBR6875921.1 TlpA family protein disulfide reductase [Bacteroidales bacterium]
MKKFVMIAAAALVALAGCKQPTSEEVLDGFRADLQALEEEYNASATKISEDATLDDAQKAGKIGDLQDEIIGKMADAGRTLLNKYYADTLVAPAVLSEVVYYLDDDELSAIFAKMPENVKSDKFVARTIESTAARLGTAVGKKFTDFTVDHVAGVDKDGNPIYEKKSLSDFVGKGKVMLVDFWSPWCPPCKAEIPNIKAVWEKYHGDDFDVLSVAVWEESRKMDWHNTIDTAAVYGMKWLQLNNGHQEPASLYGIDGIPHMILFDKDGTILKRGDDLRGAATEKAVAEVLGR